MDQYPEHWSNQVIGGTKFKAVFQLGPNQGTKLQEYHANSLADRGEFMVRGERYRSFDCSAQVPHLLASAPSINGYRVIDGPFGGRSVPNGERTPTERLPNGRLPEAANATERYRTPNGSQPHPSPPEPPFAVRSHPKRDVIEWWLDNIGGTQAAFRRWAADRGVEIGRGYVSDIFNGRSRPESEPAEDVWTINGISPDEPIYINGARIDPHAAPYTE